MRILVLIFSAVLPLVFSSCLDVETINIYLFPDKDNFNRGHAKIEFINIHSTADSSWKRQKEISEFYLDYVNDGRDIAETMSLSRHKTRLVKRESLKADGEVTGEFKSLVAVLSGILEDAEFRIEGKSGLISFYRRTPAVDDDDINLIIQYQGKIVAHNSRNFDPSTQTLKWKLNARVDKEIMFVFETSRNRW